MSRRRQWTVALVIVLALPAVALAPDAPAKPAPWCEGSGENYCNPSREPRLDPVPPDALPIAVRLRVQLGRERAAHRGEVRRLRAQIVLLESRP